MSLIRFDEGGFDLSANAAAPLQAWATEIQARAYHEEYGRGPNGFDCMGLVSFVQSVIGRPVRDYRELYRATDMNDVAALDALIRAEVHAWREAKGEPGDVLVLAIGRRACHVAALCGAGRALHVREKRDVTIEEIGSRRGVTRFAGMRLCGVVAPT